MAEIFFDWCMEGENVGTHRNYLSGLLPLVVYAKVYQDKYGPGCLG